MKIIAEIGCNHQGNMASAKKLIDTAASFCNADAVKFQKRHPKELLSEEEYSRPHPVPHNSFGETYGEHREFLEFDIDQHKQLSDWCSQAGIEYSCSVWDVTSAKEIASLKPQWVKVPSACNLNSKLLAYLADEYDGEIHISLGMTTQAEEETIVAFLDKRKRAKDVVLYNCTSGYPVAFEDLGLLEIPRLIERFGSTVKGIGFSGHHLGIAADIAAVTLGAQYVERHFTLDRTMKGTDHAASLEPDGLRKLVRNIECVQTALSPKREEILEVEKVQREKLKKNQIQWNESD
ncbi:MAG: N-acetylneuraminate synthase family protein [Myxococcales bacterium]|nr:MAG: N-acetylneuraminate synthase family protein [Myxococcales bacterium]